MSFLPRPLFAVVCAVLIAAPVQAQPAPPSGPGGTTAAPGPANTGPITPGSRASRKRLACAAKWQARHGRSGADGSPAYFRFLERCLR